MALTLLVAVGAAMLRAPSWQQQRLSVYTPKARYSIEVLERDGRQYVDLLELLRPLGRVGAVHEKKLWKVEFGEIRGEFTEGKNTGLFAGSVVKLESKFAAEGNRPLIPVEDAARLISRALDLRVDDHEAGRRIFAGNVATRFTAELRKGETSELVLSFSEPVHPEILAGQDGLRLDFANDPLVSQQKKFRFDDKTIGAVTFSEVNGAAVLIITGSGRLLAEAGGDGKTLIVRRDPNQPVMALGRAPEIRAAPEPPASLSGLPPGQDSTAALSPLVQAPIVLPPLPPPGVRPRFLVIVDAAHGGEERGALLASDLEEKHVVLALARRLRQELAARGVQSAMVREYDVTLPMEARAVLANASHAAVYLTLHAGAEGRGVRLYTSMLTPTAPERSLFLPWETAQAGYVERSRMLAGAVNGEMEKQKIAVLKTAAPLRPLNNIAAAAIAVELAPRDGDVRTLESASYQQAVAVALAQAVAAARVGLEQTP
ncbi:MAG TPA: N-acetylmuramoyl-L-alanine amidase [Terriglobales bacterium]|nr:N-acetylmuramoyl-L-alanine amidase [Terriglobales bacterium]